MGGGGNVTEQIKFVQHLKDPRTIKAAKSASEMFKDLVVAETPFAAIGGSLGAVSILFEALRPIFEALRPFLEIINGLFMQMIGEILPPLMEALTPLFEALIELSPIFVMIGEFIGELVATILPPFIDILVALMPTIKILAQLFIQIMKVALVPLTVILKIVAALLTPLMPLFEMLAKVLKPLEPIIRVIGVVVGTILYTAIRGVAFGIAALIDAVTLGAAGAIRWVKRNFPEIPSLQGGGTIIREGLVYAHAGERFTPAAEVEKRPEREELLIRQEDRDRELLFTMEDVRDEVSQTNRLLMLNMRFKGRGGAIR